MAHYKRGRCRRGGRSRRNSTTFTRKRWGFRPIKLPRRWWALDIPTRDLWPNTTGDWWGHQVPRSHDILYHTKPRRRNEAALARKVLLGRVDMEEALWPLEKKPHSYYW